MMIGDVFLEEKQDSVFDSDNVYILVAAVIAFIGKFISVLIGKGSLH